MQRNLGNSNFKGFQTLQTSFAVPKVTLHVYWVNTCDKLQNIFGQYKAHWDQK